MNKYINNITAIDVNTIEVGCAGVEEYQLKPLDGSVKSFYGKAKVLFYNGRYTLYSYNTPVLSYSTSDNMLRKEYDGYSATTARHIEAFVGKRVPKHVWDKWNILTVRSIKEVLQKD